MSTNYEPISIREFARRLGVTDAAVRKAMKAGKITDASFVIHNGKKMMIEKIARREWAAHVNRSGAQSENLTAQLSTEVPAAAITGSATSLSKAKEEKAVWDAKMAQLKYREAEGQLVDKDMIHKALHGMGQEIRDALLSVPDRVIDDVLSCKTRAEAHTMLHKALHEELERLTDHLNRMGND